MEIMVEDKVENRAIDGAIKFCADTNIDNSLYAKIITRQEMKIGLLEILLHENKIVLDQIRKKKKGNNRTWPEKKDQLEAHIKILSSMYNYSNNWFKSIKIEGIVFTLKKTTSKKKGDYWIALLPYKNVETRIVIGKNPVMARIILEKWIEEHQNEVNYLLSPES